MTVTNDEQLSDEVAEMVDTAEIDGMDEQPLPIEEQLAAAQAEAARNLDGWQRTQAECANARKRFEKQRVETYVNANADLVAKDVYKRQCWCWAGGPIRPPSAPAATRLTWRPPSAWSQPLSLIHISPRPRP